MCVCMCVCACMRVAAVARNPGPCLCVSLLTTACVGDDAVAFPLPLYRTDSWLLSLRDIVAAKGARSTLPAWEPLPDTSTPERAAETPCGVCKFPMRWPVKPQRP